MSTPRTAARAELMAQHVEARRRRDTAEPDSPAHRAACEDVARIEVAIAAAEEPSQQSPVA